MEDRCSITGVIIQQIVTMPIYGKEALNICHPYMTDIAVIACLAAILKSEAVLAVFSRNFNSLEETFHD